MASLPFSPSDSFSATTSAHTQPSVSLPTTYQFEVRARQGTVLSLGLLKQALKGAGFGSSAIISSFSKAAKNKAASACVFFGDLASAQIALNMTELKIPGKTRSGRDFRFFLKPLQPIVGVQSSVRTPFNSPSSSSSFSVSTRKTGKRVHEDEETDDSPPPSPHYRNIKRVLSPGMDISKRQKLISPVSASPGLSRLSQLVSTLQSDHSPIRRSSLGRGETYSENEDVDMEGSIPLGCCTSGLKMDGLQMAISALFVKIKEYNEDTEEMGDVEMVLGKDCEMDATQVQILCAPLNLSRIATAIAGCFSPPIGLKNIVIKAYNTACSIPLDNGLLNLLGIALLQFISRRSGGRGAQLILDFWSFSRVFFRSLHGGEFLARGILEIITSCKGPSEKCASLGSQVIGDVVPEDSDLHNWIAPIKSLWEHLEVLYGKETMSSTASNRALPTIGDFLEYLERYVPGAEDEDAIVEDVAAHLKISPEYISVLIDGFGLGAVTTALIFFDLVARKTLT